MTTNPITSSGASAATPAIGGRDNLYDLLVGRHLRAGRGDDAAVVEELDAEAMRVVTPAHKAERGAGLPAGLVRVEGRGGRGLHGAGLARGVA